MRQFVSLAAALLVAVPLQAQRHESTGLSAFAGIGWLQPTNTLASPNPGFAQLARHAAVEPGPLVTLGLEADLPAPLPQLRVGVDYSLASDLSVERRDEEARALGSVSLLAVLIEAVMVPARVGSLDVRMAVGAGFVRYGFPAVDDAELSRLLEARTISPAVDLGLGVSRRLGSLTLALDARDVISTFDTPPVESEAGDGGMIDIDEVQHDLSFSIRVAHPLWPQ